MVDITLSGPYLLRVVILYNSSWCPYSYTIPGRTRYWSTHIHMHNTPLPPSFCSWPMATHDLAEESWLYSSIPCSPTSNTASKTSLAAILDYHQLRTPQDVRFRHANIREPSIPTAMLWAVGWDWHILPIVLGRRWWLECGCAFRHERLLR